MEAGMPTGKEDFLTAFIGYSRWGPKRNKAQDNAARGLANRLLAAIDQLPAEPVKKTKRKVAK